MTCEQFRKKMFKAVGAFLTNAEIKTFNKHTEVCVPCRKILLESVRTAVAKNLKDRGF